MQRNNFAECTHAINGALPAKKYAQSIHHAPVLTTFAHQPEKSKEHQSGSAYANEWEDG